MFSKAEPDRSSFYIFRSFLNIVGFRDAIQDRRAKSGPVGGSFALSWVLCGVCRWGRSQMRAEFPACQSFLHEHFWRPAVCRPQRSPPAGSLHPCTFGCPERAGPTALRASGLLEEATVSFLLNNTVLTRQVLLWVPAVTTK